MVIICRSENTPPGDRNLALRPGWHWGLKPSAYVRRSIQGGTQHDEAIPKCFGMRTRRGQKPTAESRHQYFIARDHSRVPSPRTAAARTPRLPRHPRTGGHLTGARPVIFESTRDNLLQAHLVGRSHDNPILTPFRRSSIENGTFAVPISTVNLPSLFSVTGAVNVYRQDARSQPGFPWCTGSRVRWPTDKCPIPTAVPLRLMVTGIPCRIVVAA